MTARDQRIDGQLINLAVGGTLVLPAADCPSRDFFTRRARRWRKRVPGFKIYTRVAGGKVIAIRVQ